MDDRLRVDHDLDSICGHIKQPFRFDNFQGLIHHRRRVDGDFLAHVPGGMIESSRRGCIFHLRDRAIAKWPAAGSQN